MNYPSGIAALSSFGGDAFASRSGAFARVILMPPALTVT